MPRINRRQFLRSAAAPALLPSAQRAARRPNILFAILDDWGLGHSGAEGCNWVRTPSFDRVAREGVRFTNCFTSNPKCSPSRASILTGRNTWQLKEAINHYSIFPNEFPVFPDLLEKAGYVTGFTGKGWGPGDFQSTGWPHNPAGHPFQARTSKPPYSGISNCDYPANFSDFMARRQGEPFCFWLGFHEPHRVYEVGSGTRAGRDLAQVTLPKFFPDNRTIRADYLDYALEVEWADRQLGLVLEQLERAGELENTLVVVTSDNGAPFPRIKGQIYEQAFHLPMAVRWGAQARGGRVVDDFVNFRDFAPTFLAAAGIAAPATVTGKSFLDILRSDKSGIVDASRDVMIAGKERHDLGRPNDWGYPIRAIRTREFLYIRNFEPTRWPAGNPETGYRNCDDGPTKSLLLESFDDFYRMSFGMRPAEELYDIRTDPDCVLNLAENLKFAQVKRTLRERMMQTLREEGDPRALGQAEFFDTIRYTGPRKHAWGTWLRNNGQQ